MLLYLADIYRIGTFSEAQSDTKSEKHKDDKRVYVYTRKKMKVDGKNGAFGFSFNASTRLTPLRNRQG